MEETIIPLHDRRMRILNAQDWVGQGAAAIALLSGGWAGLRGAAGTPVWLAWADIAVGGFLLRAIMREVSSARRRVPADDADDEGGELGWVSLLGGLACFLEWGARVRVGGKVLSPVLLTGIVNVVLGLAAPYFGRKRREKRSLRLSDEGLDLRRSAMQRFRAPWSELASVTLGDRELSVAAADGRTVRLRARRYDNFDHVARAIAEHARAHGVRVLGPAGGAGIPQTTAP